MNSTIKHIACRKEPTILTLIAVLLFLLIIAEAPGQDVQPDTSPTIPPHAFEEEVPDETKFLILKVLLGKGITVSNAMISYEYEKSVMLSLSQFLEDIEFPIEVNGFEGTANGWFINPDRNFKLNLKEGKLIIDNSEMPLSRKGIKWMDGEIYVSLKLLQTWFPLDAQYLPLEQTIFFSAKERLPVEERLKRESLLNRVTNKRIDPLADTTIEEVPYDLITVPLLDLNYNFNIDKNPEIEKREHNFNISASNDLFYMTSKLNITGTDNEGVQNVHFSLGRKSLHGGLLHKLNATEFEIGDIYSPTVPLIASGTDGYGAMVSNFPLNSGNSGDTTTIRGTSQPGWDIELYRTQTLIAITKVDNTGTFEFTDVSLLPGHNKFTLKKYGKFGTIEEEEREYFNTNDVIEPGQIFYKVAANRHDINVFEIDSPTDTFDPREKSVRFLSEFQIGLLKNLSFTTGLFALPLKDKENDNLKIRANYANFGFIGTYDGIFGKLDMIRRLNDRGHAIEGFVQTVIKRFTLSFKHGEFRNGYRSEASNLQSDLMLRQTEFKIDATYSNALFPFVTNIVDDFIVQHHTEKEKKNLTDNLGKILAMVKAHKLLTVPFLSISVQGTKRVFETGRTSFDLATRVATAIKKFRISNSITYDFDKDHKTGQSTILIDGNFLFNYIYNEKIGFRGGLDYGVQPREILNNFNVAMNYKLPQDYNFSASVTQQLQDLKTSNLSLSISKAFKHILAGVTGTIDTEREMSLALSLSTGIGQNPSNKSLFVKPQTVTTSGIASVRIFYDENDNETYEEEEDTPIPNALLQVNRRTLEDHQTDENGQNLISNLSLYTPSVISTEIRSLNDPYASLPNNAFGVSPRQGRPQIIDIPVYKSGEIDGTVYLKRGDQLGEASNVTLELVNKKGKVIKTARTLFDGFYLFDFVPFGTYTVRISEEQLKRLNLKTDTRHAVTLNDENDNVYGTDFIIERMKKEEETNVDTDKELDADTDTNEEPGTDKEPDINEESDTQPTQQ